VVAGDLQRSIPSSKLTVLADRGHYFIYGEGQFENVLSELLTAHRECS